MNANLSGLAIMTLGVLAFGGYSDRFGRKPIIIIGHVMFGISIFPIFWLPAEFGTMWAAMLGSGIFSLSIALIGAPVLTALPELFPAAVRATGGALPYNIATILACFAPYVAVLLQSTTHNVFAYPMYVAGLATFGIIGAVFLYTDPSRSSRREVLQLIQDRKNDQQTTVQR